MKSKFLGIPIIYVSVLYLIVQLICFTVIVASKAQSWVAVVSSVSILGVFCLLIISGEISRNTVKNVEQKISDNTTFIKNFRQQIDCLIIDEKDPVIKAKLQEVADVAKYSESSSTHESIIEENNVKNQLEAFSNDTHTVQILDLIVDSLNKRNIIIRSGR